MPLDPILQNLLNQIPAVPPGPVDYPALRQMSAAFIPMLAPPATLSPIGSMEELSIDGAGGPIPLRIYRPVGDAAGIVHYMHGGGWALGDLPSVDHTARRFCHELSMVIVTSTYRLAPENPFPAGFDDSLLAARWVLAHRVELGGESLPTAIAGDSAGGNLAAAIALALRDAGDASFDVQALLYPAVDLREDADYPSRRRNADPTLNAEQLGTYIDDYAGGSDLSDQRLSPLAADSVANVPPALIVVQSVDPLHDEAVAYAHRLQEAGVRVELMEFDNMTHGFVHLSALVPAAAAATAEVTARLRAMMTTID
ncbi:alpha/beta hydrolase [Sphingomonas cynarae]|uniref:Alpha/beta hydrolase n=1 Tax=Sphingomonas cynarae TaxID=930197 RepID=A0ABP7D040_9SPHN